MPEFVAYLSGLLSWVISLNWLEDFRTWGLGPFLGFGQDAD